MRHKDFLWFVLPTMLAMTLFIAAPIISVVIQSMFAPHEQVIIEVENCDPFGCTTQGMVDQTATQKLNQEKPLGKFVGTEIYTNRNHLAFAEIADIWRNSNGFKDFYKQLLNLPFYGALAFTLTYTAVVTPLALILGFFVAFGVNAIPRMFRGTIIFFSLLPMIVTPLVGALILFWMIDSRGIIGHFIQYMAADPNLSLKASTGLTWMMLMVYGVWQSTPLAFIIYYAGLQTVPEDVLESAMIDGANTWHKIRHVILPHLLPLTLFMALIKIMDNFRVFEPIVSFNAEAHAQSLSSFIYSDINGETRLLSSAAATSVLTILGVVILLTPILMSSWKSYGKKK
ncbi:MAG: sugar ABC transporter permease [Alphaproteobacteria bacterium]|nr:sugar ABC transporter permease [Alphaproteobacteria bacterium]